MSRVSPGANLAIARRFPVEPVSHCGACRNAPGRSDYASGTGESAYRGNWFDLPEVGPIFEESGFRDESNLFRGSFMDQPLPKGDVIMMGHVLHDWNLEIKRLLVRKAYEA
jgi:hypothetical protein